MSFRHFDQVFHRQHDEIRFAKYNCQDRQQQRQDQADPIARLEEVQPGTGWNFEMRPVQTSCLLVVDSPGPRFTPRNEALSIVKCYPTAETQELVPVSPDHLTRNIIRLYIHWTPEQGRNLLGDHPKPKPPPPVAQSAYSVDLSLLSPFFPCDFRLPNSFATFSIYSPAAFSVYSP